MPEELPFQSSDESLSANVVTGGLSQETIVPEPQKVPDHFEVVRQPTTAFEEIKRSLDLIATSINTEAVPDATSPTMRKQFLEEAEAILEGLDSPHPELGFLRSRRVMISYSRGDETQARKLSLGLQATGMVPWLDIQASNVSQPGVQPPPPVEDGARGIGLGLSWEEALEDAPPEEGYGIVMLTHKALDKFDIIGGVEIPGMLQADSKIVIAHFDDRDEEGRTVLNRVQEMMGNDSSHEEALRAITDAVDRGSVIAMRPEYFDGSARDLGNFVVSALARSPNTVFANTVAQETHPNPNAYANTDAEAVPWDTLWPHLEVQLNALQQTILPEDLQGMCSFEEARVLIEGVVRPDLVAARLEDKDFYIPEMVMRDNPDAAQRLALDLTRLGLKNRSQEPVGQRGTALLLTSEELIREQWQVIADDLLEEFGSEGLYVWRRQLPNPTIWQIWDGNVPAALVEVDSEKSTAKWLSSLQAVFDSLHVADPGLAACLVTRQALVEVARRYRTSGN